MKFQSGKEVYEVTFKHFINEEPKRTLCVIAPMHNPDEGSCYGIAYLANGDQFCKVTGRKIAFARALQVLLPGLECKNQRETIWSEFKQKVRWK